MGKRKEINGLEQDAVTGWRHVLCYMQNRKGLRSWVKRGIRRRERHQGKTQTRGGGRWTDWTDWTDW